MILKINKKKFIYLISPNKITTHFYQNLEKVLKTGKVSFFQMRLKKYTANQKILIGEKMKKICKKKGSSFEILREYPVVTSSRKLLWFSPFHIFLSILIPTLFPLALKSKSLCGFWYRRPNHKENKNDHSNG